MNKKILENLKGFAIEEIGGSLSRIIIESYISINLESEIHPPGMLVITIGSCFFIEYLVHYFFKGDVDKS